MALFFQQEILRAATSGTSSSTPPEPLAPHNPTDTQPGTRVGGGGAAVPSSGQPSAAGAGALPVLLLSGDNAQVQMAKAHGLPAVRMSEVAAAQAELARRVLGQGQPLTATLLRELWGPAAVRGLGNVAARGLQQEFDGAVACLAALISALAAARQQLAGLQAIIRDDSLSPERALAALSQLVVPVVAGGSPAAAACVAQVEAKSQSLGWQGTHLQGGGEELPQAALQCQLEAWQGLVRARQDPNWVLSRMGSFT